MEMPIKPNGQMCNMKEQIVEDPASGLTLQFERWDNGCTRLLICGNLPFGNREIIFDQYGEEGAAGTALVGVCRPSWLREVK